MAFALLRKALGLNTEKKAVTLTDPAAWEIFGAIPTHSGVTVSAASALRVPAVACAAALISETIGTLPVKLRERDSKEEVREHPAAALLNEEANPWTSAGQLRAELTLDALMQDRGGLALVVRGGSGTPAEIHRLDPQKVTQETAPDGEPLYTLQTAQGARRVPFTDMVHVRPFGGIAPLTSAREAIGIALQCERHLGGVFRNGGRPSGIIRAQRPLDIEAKKRLVASWFNTHSGTNSGGTAILDEGMDYTAISMSLADAQFSENRIEQIREIARAFRIPAPMIGELGRATWSNLEQLQRQFLQTTLAPYLRQWEAAYARVLLSEEERQTLRVEFVVDALLETDAAQKAAAYASYRSMGAMTGNEVRAGLNLPRHADGDSLSNPHITTPGATAPAPDETTE